MLLDSTRQTKSICMKRQHELCSACPLTASVKTYSEGRAAVSPFVLIKVCSKPDQG